MNKNKIIAEKIYNVIGENNVVSFTNCVTRLRLTLNKHDSNMVEKLKQIDGVLSVILSENQVQIVIGTNVKLVTIEFEKIVKLSHKDNVVSKTHIQNTKNKYNKTNPFKNFLAKFSKIFVPLIPGFIAAGLLSGISQLLITSFHPNVHTFLFDVTKFLGSFQIIMSAIMTILIGYNCAKEFGGSGVNGAILSGFYLLSFGEPIVGKMALGINEFFNFKLNVSGGVLHGSIIGVLMSSILVAKLETLIRKFIHPNLDLILTSALSLIISAAFTILVIGSVSGFLFENVSKLFVSLSTNPFGAAILAGIFLIAVVFGVHQGFIPVYTSLIAKYSMNTLFPILAMAGAGQVGGAFAMYLKEKNPKTKKIILSAIVPGIMGIGEPLIYGVTLPKVKPFITSCLGGAMGGLFLGIVSMFGTKIGLNSVFGPSGIIALPLMKSNNGIILAMIIYLFGLIISYIFGFVFTYFFGIINDNKEGIKNEN